MVKLLVMCQGQYITVIIRSWDIVVDGAILIFVVDSGELGVGLFDTLGNFAHGKKYD